jgi:hypothetical protein
MYVCCGSYDSADEEEFATNPYELTKGSVFVKYKMHFYRLCGRLGWLLLFYKGCSILRFKTNNASFLDLTRRVIRMDKEEHEIKSRYFKWFVRLARMPEPDFMRAGDAVLTPDLIHHIWRFVVL